MKTLINFYISSGENDNSYEDLVTGIETDNPMYLTLKTGDTIILPKEKDVEFMVNELVKDFSREELDVYVSRIKSNDEIIDELGLIANKTIQSMLDSFKGVFSELDKTINSNVQNSSGNNVVYIDKVNETKKEEK
jgi:hypothetical protein